MKKILEFMSLLQPYRSFVIKAIGVAILLNMLEIPIPYLTKVLIDDVYSNKDLHLMIAIVLAIFSVTFFNLIVGIINGYYVSFGGLNISLDLKYSLLKRLLSQSFKFFDNHDIGAILSRFDDADEAIHSTVSILASFIMNIISILIFPAVLMLINWKLTILALVILPFDILITWFSNKYIKSFSEKLAKANADNLSKKVELLEGIRVIQSLNLQKTGFQKIQQSFENIRSLSLGRNLVTQSSGFFSGLISSLGTLLFTYVGWVGILGNELSLGTFMAFSMYIGHLYRPLKSMIGLSQQLQIAIVHTSRFFEIYNHIPEVKDSPNALKLSNTKGEIKFENVYFSYEDNQQVLTDINLNIEQGQQIAFVSRSGGGKSTLLGLLPRFYESTKGRILLDGTNIKDIKLSSLRKKIGFVWQEPEIFTGTVYDNILMRRFDATQKDVIKAAKMASAHKFILDLHDGYETPVGENGSSLSVGQKQRICFARVLLMDSPVLILDEVTSSLDAESESEITQVIKNLKNKKTILMIAHRLSTIQHADKIIVLDQGKIVEQGSHNELINIKDGIYQNLYNTQKSSMNSKTENLQIPLPQSVMV